MSIQVSMRGRLRLTETEASIAAAQRFRNVALRVIDFPSDSVTIAEDEAGLELEFNFEDSRTGPQSSKELDEALDALEAFVAEPTTIEVAYGAEDWTERYIGPAEAKARYLSEQKLAQIRGLVKELLPEQLEQLRSDLHPS